MENIIKKIDDSYRVLIPMEIRDTLGLHKGQEVELSIDDNDNIILKPRNIKVEVIEESKPEDDLLKDEPIIIPTLEERLSSKIPNKEKPKSEICYKCGSILEEGNRLRLNGRKICKSCTENLKKELLYNIYINNHVKDSKKDLDDLN